MRAIHTFRRTAHRSLVIFGLVLLLLGFTLWVGGVRLVLLGGSWYYVLAATGMWIAMETPPGDYVIAYKLPLHRED